jgi:TPR repeat protein
MGNAYAMEKLGLLYQLGQGVKQDNTLAAMWYRKSVQNGNTADMSNLKLAAF